MANENLPDGTENKRFKASISETNVFVLHNKANQLSHARAEARKISLILSSQNKKNVPKFADFR